MSVRALSLMLCGWLWLGTTAAAPELPVQVPDAEWRPLPRTVDADLQAALEQRLRKDPQMAQLMADKHLAVALVDLTDPAAPRYARVNGGQMMYAASLPKIAILFAAFEQADRGKLSLDPAVEKDLHDMIRVSSNSAATRMIDRLGGLRQINRALSDPRYGFYSRLLGGGLWVGKRYAKTGGRDPDPVNGISHGATAFQVARMYYQLATGRLISAEASAGMLEILADPALHHKFVKQLDQRAPDARVYRKSGTWERWHADSVLVWGEDWRRYILVGMVESPQGETIIQRLVPMAERALQEARHEPDYTDH